jgi:sulfide:quinone oxidoreductase
VELVIERAIQIDPGSGTVQLARGGNLDWDYLVIATGARLVPERIPGLVEGAHEF